MKMIGSLAALILLFGFLVSCKEGFKVEVADSGNQVPIFRLSSAGVFSTPGVEIDSFIVSKFPGNGSDFLWGIEAKDKKPHLINEITYGALPKGFKETNPPPKLVSGSRYVVGSFMPGKAGWTDFTLK
jgi:hypothetical protein